MTTTAPTAPAATGATATCTLEIGGMTCASCVRRVEKALGRLDGVTTQVNLATEVATVRFDPARVGLPELTAAVAPAGYTATPRRETRPTSEPTRTGVEEPGAEPETDRDAQLAALERRWEVTLAAGLALMVLM